MFEGKWEEIVVGAHRKRQKKISRIFYQFNNSLTYIILLTKFVNTGCI